MWHEMLKNAARGPTAAEDGRNDKKYERGTCRIRKRCGTSGAPQGYSTVGCGCFVNVEHISELPSIEYAIITSSKVFQKEFDARKYLVQFKKLDSKLKTFELDSALFSHGQILQDPASGLTVIPLNPKSTVFSHQLQFAPASKTCSVLKNNHFEVEYVLDGFLKCFNALCCHTVVDDPSNDRSFGVITQELTQNSSGQCILSGLPRPRVALGAAVVKRDKKKWSLVGVLNSDSCVPENFRPLWLSRGKFENLRWVKAIPAESNHSVNGGGDAGSTSGGGDGTNGGEDSGSDAGGTNGGNDGGGDSTNGGEGDDDDTSGGDDGDGTNDGNDAGGDAISANGSGHATSANGGGDSDCGNGDADGTNGTGHVEGASRGGDANNGDVVGGDDVNNGCGGGPPGDSDRSKHNDGDNNKNDVYDSYSRDFKATLEHLKQAAEQGFKNLQRVSTNLMKNLPALELAEDNYLNEVDWECQELIPTSKSTVYRALKTTSDGNCFFRAASILAFRDENRHEEMRVRIVVELSVNDKFYLKDKDLCRRIEAQEKEIYPRSKNITSEMNPEVIKEVFEEEVLDTARSASWASYWHLPALGAVLNRLVQSVYPECGGSEVKKYFNALICPRLLDPEKEPVTIMWTRTGASGGDGTHFRPNHFVPLVSVDKMMPFPVDEPRNGGASPTETSYISLMHATTPKDENSPDSSKDLFSQMKEGVRRSNSLSLSGLTRKEEHQKIPHCESFPLLKQVQSDKVFSSDCATNGDHSANSSKSLKGMVVNLPPENAKEALMAPPSRIIPQDQLSCQPTANSGALLQGPNNNPPAARSRDHSILPKNHSCPSDLAKMEELPKVKRSASELLPRPPEGKQKFYPSDLLAKTILGCLELLEGLCRCLDKEYTYGTSKCWKHIAEAFGIKEQDYQNFKCSQFHSPTEVMFEYLKTCSPEVTVGHVKDGLSSIERQDVIAVFVKYEQLYQTPNDETLMCSLFDSHPDIIGEIAFLLDMQKAGLKNWSHLAAKLDIPRDVFKSFETFSADNPAERLFEIIKIRFPRSTIGELIGHLQAMKRLDVVNAIKESAEVTDDSLISDLMEDLDVTYRVCELLNQQLRTSKVLGWKHLGKRFGFNKATLDDLSPTQEEIISPTEALIRHLGGSMPWLSIENFIWALHNNDRNDALGVLHVYLPDGCIPNILKSCDCQRCQMSRQEENTRLQWR